MNKDLRKARTGWILSSGACVIAAVVLGTLSQTGTMPAGFAWVTLIGFWLAGSCLASCLASAWYCSALLRACQQQKPAFVPSPAAAAAYTQLAAGLTGITSVLLAQLCGVPVLDLRNEQGLFLFFAIALPLSGTLLGRGLGEVVRYKTEQIHAEHMNKGRS